MATNNEYNVTKASDGGFSTAAGQFPMSASWPQAMLIAFLGYLIVNQVVTYHRRTVRHRHTQLKIYRRCII
jgi:cytosine/uracil/thiamine/allantoin permease